MLRIFKNNLYSLTTTTQTLELIKDWLRCELAEYVSLKLRAPVTLRYVFCHLSIECQMRQNMISGKEKFPFVNFTGAK